MPGVGGAEVRSAVEQGLRFFFSEVEADELSSRDIVTAAQQVHAVISDIFLRSAVLPFRYPTVVTDDRELTTLAQERGAAFREYLERVRGKVQMDVRLTMDTESPHSIAPKPGAIRVGQPGSGRAYLEARARRQAVLTAAAETCGQTAHSADWRIQQRDENIRCQCLISRLEVLSFLERMRTLELPEGVKAAVSGPWPPAGFWEDEPR